MSKDIAIIGIATEVPKTSDLTEFWDVISSGRCLADEFPQERRADIVNFINYKNRTSLEKPRSMEIRFHRGSYLDRIDGFDYRFFGMSPKQASATDPHQRLVLKTMYLAFEDAGYLGKRISGSRTGVFVGYASNPGASYSDYVLTVDPGAMQVALTGQVPTMMANRISHFLNLHGASLIADSACSASLMAVHLAKNAIRSGDCDMAVVSGVRIVFMPLDSPERRIGIESADGMTRTFDQRADGTGFGEGSGAIVLKALDQAVRDGDHVYAVIKGSAINHDGHTESLTNPDAAAQAKLLLAAWKDAGVDAASIGYFEAHGTATRIGDPIEIDGLTRAFAEHTAKKQFCAIGTVKSNIGHLFEGSGVMGVIKGVLCLQNQAIPPVANFSQPNPKIDFEGSPVYIPTELQHWKAANTPRRCGVSAFGLGGTNCHVVLEEYIAPARASRTSSTGLHLFTLSAATQSALDRLVDRYIAWLESPEATAVDLTDLCYTSNVSRSHYDIKLAVLAADAGDLKDKLKAVALGEEGRFSGAIFSTQRRDAIGEQSANVANPFSPAGMRELCVRYLDGADISWQNLYEGQSARTIRLPAYSFEEHACWVPFPVEAGLDLAPSEPVMGHPQFSGPPTHLITFRPAEPAEPVADTARVLVMHDASQNLARFVPAEHQGSATSIALVDGVEPANESQILNQRAEYDRIAQMVVDAGITHVVHALAMEQSPAQTLEELDRRSAKNLHSLFLLTQALMSVRARVKLSVVTHSAVPVPDSQAVSVPEHAMLFGFSKVVPRENASIRVSVIDIDHEVMPGSLYDNIVGNDFGLWALRGSQRFRETFEELDTVADVDRGPVMKSGGAYLVTGGAGALGLETCRLLVRMEPDIHLFLLGRSDVAAREDWPQLIRSTNDEKLRNRLQTFLDLEAHGATLHFVKADVSNAAQMEAAVRRIQAQFKRIDGIVHAAGIPGQHFIQNRTLEDFDAVIRSKLQGAFLLDQLTQGDRPDFIVYFSSVASVFPSGGQADYAAANYYLDALALSNRDPNCHVIAFDWVAWKEIGMAVDYGTNGDTTFKALPTAVGMGLLEEGLRSTKRRVFAGAVNYNSELMRILRNYDVQLQPAIASKIDAALADLANANSESNNLLRSSIDQVDVSLSGRDDGQYTAWEVVVAKCWADSLGYHELDIHDDFFDVGGDSIGALSVASAISTYASIEVESSDMLAHRTIHAIAAFVEEALGGK